MGWFGPSGNCGCCGSQCECATYAEPAPNFTVYGIDPVDVTLTISGIPSSVDVWIKKYNASLGKNQFALYNVPSFDDIEGTFTYDVVNCLLQKPVAFNYESAVGEYAIDLGTRGCTRTVYDVSIFTDQCPDTSGPGTATVGVTVRLFLGPLLGDFSPGNDGVNWGNFNVYFVDESGTSPWDGSVIQRSFSVLVPDVQDRTALDSCDTTNSVYYDEFPVGVVSGSPCEGTTTIDSGISVVTNV